MVASPTTVRIYSVHKTHVLSEEFTKRAKEKIDLQAIELIEIIFWHFFCFIKAVSFISLEGLCNSELFPTNRLFARERKAYTIFGRIAAECFPRSCSNAIEFSGSRVCGCLQCIRSKRGRNGI